jgi:4-diphosphocytidyl-2-C-methyl-D-erythritol kinase
MAGDAEADDAATTVGPAMAGDAGVTAAAPAKLNLHLGVGRRGADGYHPLCTVFQAVDLWEQVTACRSEIPGIRVSVTGPGAERVPLDGTNLAIRAAVALAEYTDSEPALDLVITKAIPVAGGLAGGSADAAAALLACDALWQTGLAPEELLELGAGLGADVPFALTGGTALGTGRGEQLEPLEVGADLWWVLATRADGLSTPAIFTAWDALTSGDTEASEPADPSLDDAAPSSAAPYSAAASSAEPPSAAPPAPSVWGLARPDALISALARGSTDAIGQVLANDLQEVSLREAPAMRAVIGTALAAGADGAVVTGSGPTVAALAPNRDAAEVIGRRLEAEHSAIRVFTVRNVSGGAHLGRW